MRSYQRGSIVWVEITDPQGGNPKCRPAVIVTPTEEIRDDSSVWVIGITTKVEDAPAECSVELPWHRGGHPRTGLKMRSVAVCTWLKQVAVTDIQESAGTVTGGPMLRILNILSGLGQPPPAPPPTP